jgi:magnesium transporter
MGFLVICFGITILQMSRIDPVQFKNLDRKSTILLQATRSRREGTDMDSDEKSVVAMEDPGVDSLRGSFGTIGSIIRARSARKMSMSMRPRAIHGEGDPSLNELRIRYPKQRNSDSIDATPNIGERGYLDGLQRHQLYDPPVPDKESSIRESTHSRETTGHRHPTIKFGSQDIVHSYRTYGDAIHEHRAAAHPPPTRHIRTDESLLMPISDNYMTTIFPSPIETSESASDLHDEPPISLLTNVTSGQRSRRSKSSSAKSSSDKRYPRGDAEVDREESQSLWDVSESGDESQLEDVESTDREEEKHNNVREGGVRLVAKSGT